MTTTTSPCFADLAIRPDILAGLDALGFHAPTPIQSQVIPPLLAGCSDLVGLAQTGTGKTAAFGIPLIQACDAQKDGVQALVLCPTRELCMQVMRDLRAIAKQVDGLKIVAVYGGARIGEQISALRRGAQIVVATPGRLVDLLERGAIQLGNVQTLVLDEADEMLSMGFRDDLHTILGGTPEGRSTLLFSATMSRDISAMAKRFMKSPVEITVGRTNEGAANITHHYYMVRCQDRYSALRRIVDSQAKLYGIVFCRTRQDCQDVAASLVRDGYNAEALHGDLNQGQRDAVMQKFRRAHTPILVATDVAARGLDVNNLTHVIHYHLPDDMSVYTHRAGRTGRAGRAGQSICLATPQEGRRIRALERRLKTRFAYKKVPSGSTVCKQRLQQQVDALRAVDTCHELVTRHMETIGQQLAGLDRQALIERFLTLELKDFLDGYTAAPDLNAQEDTRSRIDESRPRGRRRPPSAAQGVRRGKPARKPPARGNAPHKKKHKRAAAH